MKKVSSKVRILSAVIMILAVIGALLLINQNGSTKKAVEAAAGTNYTVIIDAGHGGADGGAVSISGVKESSVNLDISTRLDTILGFFGVQTLMTRTTEELSYSEKSDTIRQKKAEDQARRLKLIGGTQNPVLLSIHQNNFPSGSPSGAQVLYAPTSGSKEFAENMQALLIGALNNQNRRTAAQAPKGILLMNHITCPALLIECGFLSNAKEEKLLMTDEYRLKIAAVIAAGYLSCRDELIPIDIGG